MAEHAMNERGPSCGGDGEEEGRSPRRYSETVNVQPVDGKLKILFIAANPDDMTRLKLDEEFRSIQNRIRESEFRDRIKLVIRQAVRDRELTLALLEEKPHVVHFSGHGNERDELILQDDQGNSRPVSRDVIVSLFKTLKDDIRLVVFNACFSEPQAQGIVENIAFAIGMNQAIGDEAAIQFSESLYQGIGFGRTIQEAFDLGKIALQQAGIGENLTPRLLAHSTADASEIRLVDAKDRSPSSRRDIRKITVLGLVCAILAILTLVSFLAVHLLSRDYIDKQPRDLIRLRVDAETAAKYQRRWVKWTGTIQSSHATEGAYRFVTPDLPKGETIWVELKDKSSFVELDPSSPATVEGRIGAVGDNAGSGINLYDCKLIDR